MVNGRQSSRSFKGFLMFGLLVLSGYFIYSACYDVKTMLSLQLSIQNNENLLSEVQARKEELETTKSNLTNPDYIEYLARGKYLVTKEGEQIFKFPAISKQSSDSE